MSHIMDELKKSEQEQLQSINSNCAQVSDLASTELILDPVSERRILRKIDLVVLPLVSCFSPQNQTLKL